MTIPIYSGFLTLEPGRIEVVGGKVEKMLAKWEAKRVRTKIYCCLPYIVFSAFLPEYVFHYSTLSSAGHAITHVCAPPLDASKVQIRTKHAPGNGKAIRKEIFTFSNKNGYVWTGPNANAWRLKLRKMKTQGKERCTPPFLSAHAR